MGELTHFFRESGQFTTRKSANLNPNCALLESHDRGSKNNYYYYYLHRLPPNLDFVTVFFILPYRFS